MRKKLLLSLALALGLASNTWALDQVGGVYQIGSAQDLVDFAALVNGGTFTADAVLTDDIDMSTLSTWTAIGDWNTNTSSGSNACYKGHFDGQNHKITGFNGTASHNYYGIFGVISSCLIENFSVYGTFSTSVATAGSVAGYARDANTTIRNVHSYVEINNTVNGKRVGGILGTSHNGTIFVDRCTYSGILDGKDSDKNGNYGGIVGYVNNNSSAKLQVTNCLFDGELKNTASTPGSCTFGGIIGYVGANITDMTIKNCLSIGTVTSTVTGQFYGAVKSSGATIVNSYYKGDNVNGSSSTVTLTATKLDADDARLTSGELCYLLNESESGGTNWYQALGTDGNPLPYGTDKVYANSSYYCDMTLKEVTYSNTEGNTIDPHSYSNGICSACGAPDAAYMTANSEGYYEIGTPAQLKWFSAFVNAGHPDINAKLTTNINMASVAWTPIGNASVKYEGIFDGQHYAITNFSYTATAQYAGLFGYITTATIKNFSISGALSSAYNYTGMIGCATAAKVSGIHSSLNVTATAHTWVGGIVAGANGAIEIAECTYDGTLNTSNGNAVGGIMGYANTGTIRNCIFCGTLEGNGADHFGGILGYVANAGFGGVENCLSTGTIDTSGGTFGNYAYLIGNINTNTKLTNIKNNYFVQRVNTCPGYAGAIADQAEASIPVSSSQLESGEVCYLLNGDQSTITFYQTIGTDAYPTFDSSHGQVYRNGVFCRDTNFPQGTYSYGNNNESSTADHSFTEGFCSYCGYPDEDYISVNGEGFYEIATPTQFKWFAAYVNCIDPTVNAKLTANIDLNNVTWTPIGNDSNKYTGTFDGCGYTISNLTTEPCVYNGLFGYINGATVQNFNINGYIETLTSGTMNYIGVIGMSEKVSHISGIHSSLNIIVHCESDAGGVLGSGGSVSGEDKLFIDCCSFSGKLTIDDGVAKDQFGGIVGYTASATITNCLFNGTLSGSASNRGFGGILGYTNVYIGGVQNCLSIGNFSGTGGRYGTIIGNYNSTTDRKDRVKNNYYLSGSIAGAGNNPDKIEATGISAVQLASGEVAYKLGSAWYQTIGADADANPVLDSSSEKVLYVGAAGYSTFYDAENDWALSSYNDDAKAFIGTLTPSGGALHLEEIDDIPTGTAVIISGTYYNKVSTTATASTAGNILIGSTGYTVPADRDIFALGIDDDVVGFYPVNAGVNIPAGKAYLDLTGSSVKEFLTFVFDDDDPTGINEELRMMYEESISLFNLAGQRLSKMQKGINIVNGKKVMVK